MRRTRIFGEAVGGPDLVVEDVTIEVETRQERKRTVAEEVLVAVGSEDVSGVQCGGLLEFVVVEDSRGVSGDELVPRSSRRRVMSSSHKPGRPRAGLWVDFMASDWLFVS
jgi:hypothetical protein